MLIRERLVLSYSSEPPSLTSHLIPCFHWAIVLTIIYVLMFDRFPVSLDSLTREPSKLHRFHACDHLGSTHQHQGSAFSLWVALFL